MQDRGVNRRKRVVTIGQLRERFVDLLLDEDEPVMVTRNGVPLGFFLPAKVWRSQADSRLSAELVELVLGASGQTLGDLKPCIDEAVNRRCPPLKLANIGL